MPDMQAKPRFVRPLTTGIPAADRRMVPRARLMTRLDAATKASRIVIVGAEAGSGKTSMVASWANQAGPRAGVYWRDLRQSPSALDVLDRLPAELAEWPIGDRALRAVGHERQSGARGGSVPIDHSVIILDDFPVDPDDRVAAALDRLVHKPGHPVSLVLVCAGSPTLDLQRLGVAAECRDVGSEELAMNPVEIGAALTREAVDPTPTLIQELSERTCGWAWGVRLAASLLARSESVSSALRETDHAIADYLQHSILRDLADPTLELITATSTVADVSPGLAAAVVGDERGLSRAAVTQMRGFVRTRGDGSFAVHPLLRRHLLSRLRRRPGAAGVAARRAAQHTAETGDLGSAISIAVGEGDWTWAAETLVESLHVPRLLMSGAEPLLDAAGVVDQLGAAQPILLAAAALGRSWPDVAARALVETDTSQEHPGSSSPATQLSESLVRMALARWEGDVESGLMHQHQAVALVPKLSLAQRTAAPELAPLLQSHAGAFEAMNGAPDRARAALERGARAFRPQPASITAPTAVAAAACLGQLAWQEAVAGELATALHHAAAVLAARPADSNELGVVHAELATIWCQISRDEVGQAIQRFQSVIDRGSMPDDGAVLPELAVITGLTAARLAAAGHGGVGHRLDQACAASPCARQYEHRLSLIRAEQELDAGMPTAALQILGDATQHSTEVAVLRARAWIQLGDLASVGASLRVRPVEVLDLLPRMQLDLVEAWLARAHGDRVRQRSMIDRVLRTARREQLRRPIAWAKSWLLDAVGPDPVLLQRHGPFLASLRNIRLGCADAMLRPAAVAAPVSDLTEREIDILQRLGALSTNEEIAADLYLSPNTVKTHLKSLYRKLEVTRRSDAFRRGRALGLC